MTQSNFCADESLFLFNSLVSTHTDVQPAAAFVRFTNVARKSLNSLEFTSVSFLFFFTYSKETREFRRSPAVCVAELRPAAGPWNPATETVYRGQKGGVSGSWLGKRGSKPHPPAGARTDVFFTQNQDPCERQCN